MPRYAYDLHIHTCLSPCGDNEMTPPNIANMAYVKGLDLIAVTDHNSAKNARAVMNAARDLPLTVIPGAELTTAEEIHVVCLLPDADSAEAFDRELETHMPQIPNQPDYFGDQLLMDENENVTGTFPWLLPNALDLSIDAVPALCEKFGGVCFPAHIDRPANGILAVFGLLPDTPVFPTLGSTTRKNSSRTRRTKLTARSTGSSPRPTPTASATWPKLCTFSSCPKTASRRCAPPSGRACAERGPVSRPANLVRIFVPSGK